MLSPGNWLLFAAVNGWLWYAADCAACRCLGGARGLALRLVAGGLIHLALATVAVLFMGAVAGHLASPAPYIAASLPALVLVLTCRRARRPLFAPVAEAARRLRASRDLALYVLLLLFVLQAAVLLAKVALLPPHLVDVFVYHLAPAVEWFQQGRIPLAIDTPVQHMNGVPLGMTVLSYWFFSFFEDDFLVQLPMFLWALLLVPVTYAFMRRAGVGRAWAMKFAIVIFFVPIVLMQAFSCKDQLGLNVAFIAGLLFLAEYLRSGRPGQLVVAAVAFGLMLGYKQAAPAYLAVAALLFAVALYQRRDQLLHSPARRRGLVAGLAGGGLITLLIAGYWYLRRGLAAWVTLPPPRALGGNELAAAGQGSRFSLDGVLHNLGQFLPRVFDYQFGYYGADLVKMSGFGPQFAAFGLPALVLALAALAMRRSYRQAHFLVVGAAAVLLLLFFIPNYSAASNSYRILSFLPMVMIAYGGIRLWRSGWLGHRAVAAAANLVMLASVLWSAWGVLPPKYTNPLLLREYLTSDLEDRTSGTYTRWFIVHRPEFYRLLVSMPPTEPVAVLWDPRFKAYFTRGPGKTWSYPYYDRHWRRRLHYLYREHYLECRAPGICRPTARLKEALRQRRITLVSACPANYCAAIRDPDFIELAPGFYYFRGAKGHG